MFLEWQALNPIFHIADVSLLYTCINTHIHVYTYIHHIHINYIHTYTHYKYVYVYFIYIKRGKIYIKLTLEQCKAGISVLTL